MIIKIIFRLAIFKICLLNFINSVDSEGLKEIILNKYEYELNVSKFELKILNLNTELYDMKYSLNFLY